MSNGKARGAVLRFGEFALDVERGALFRAGEEIRLRPQSFRVLCYLVENRGRLLSRNELLDAIWGRTVVTEGSLTQCLIDVRRALGDEARELVRTVPRRGYVFDAPVTEDTVVEAPGRQRAGRRRTALALAAAAVAVLLAITWLLLRPGAPEPGATAGGPRSIAVLPFEDMSEDDQEFLADGLAEEILNTLARGSGLQVMARTSSFSFKDKRIDIETIGERLRVDYVLQGSVRRSGDRVRVSAQLIDATNGRQLWSNIFDRTLTDVFDTQREIATAVADALAARLAPMASAAPPDAEAYELYLQGRFFHNRRGPGDPELAEQYHRRALAVDPTFGRAWAGLAGALLVQVAGGEDTPENRAAWKEAVERALEHAPRAAEAHLRAAQYFWHAGDEARARIHHGRAMELGPNEPLVLTAAAGVETFNGRAERAVDLYRQAIRLDPLSAVYHVNFSLALAAAGRFDEAIEEGRKAAELNPGFATEAEQNEAFLLILDGRPDAAATAVARWPESAGRDAALAMLHRGTPASDAALAGLVRKVEAGPDAPGFQRVAEVHAFRGERDQAFRWLERGRAWARGRSRAQGDERIHELWQSPFLVELHEDARWAPIVAGKD